MRIETAREVARTHFRATVLSAILGLAGVVLAAWIGATVGRNRAENENKDKAEQKDAQILERDRENARLRQEIESLRKGEPVPVSDDWREPKRSEDFTFTLQGCARRGTAVACTFTTLADQRDRRLLVWGKSRIIDGNGKEWLASTVTLAGTHERVNRHHAADKDLIRGVPINGEITFDLVPPEQTKASVIELHTSDGDIQFRDVPLA